MTKSTRLFPPRDLIRAAGTNIRDLSYRSKEKGFIVPVTPSTKAGSANRYDIHAALLYVLAAKLESYGFIMDAAYLQARFIIDHVLFHTLRDDEENYCWLIKFGTDGFLIKKNSYYYGVPEIDIASEIALVPFDDVFLIVDREEYRNLINLIGADETISFYNITKMIRGVAERLKISMQELEEFMQ